MTTVSIDADGIKEIVKSLKGLEGGIDDLKAVHAAAAAVVEMEAERRVPKRSGKLRSSIRSSGQQKDGVIRAGLARVPYAGVIEFGWPERGIRPSNYMYGARDAKMPEVMGIYEDGVTGLLKKHNLQ